MGTSTRAEPTTGRSRGRASDPETELDEEREEQYDLLTAALIGAAVGAGITLLMRRGPSGRRPVGPLIRYAGRGAALAGLAGMQGGRWAAERGLDGARWAGPRAKKGFKTAVERGGELIDRLPIDEVTESVRDYADTAREAINDA